MLQGWHGGVHPCNGRTHCLEVKSLLSEGGYETRRYNGAMALQPNRGLGE